RSGGGGAQAGGLAARSHSRPGGRDHPGYRAAGLHPGRAPALGGMSPRFEEAMRELAVRGTHGAAEALARFLGRRIATEHISCGLTTAAKLADRLGRTTPASAVGLTIVGGSTGTVIVLLPGDSAVDLGEELTGAATRQMALSAVEEAGNILVSAYL